MEPHASLEKFEVLLFTGWLAWAQAPATRWDLERYFHFRRHHTPLILTPTRSDPFYVHFGFNWRQGSLRVLRYSAIGNLTEVS
jgi:hypothetical protein